MLINTLIAFCLVLGTVLIHALGFSAVLRFMMRSHALERSGFWFVNRWTFGLTLWLALIHVATVLMLPAFVLLILAVRGLPVLIYRSDLAQAQRLPFALSSAVPSVSIIVVITGIGVQAKTMTAEVATALVGAGLLCVLLFPTIAGILLNRTATTSVSASGENP